MIDYISIHIKLQYNMWCRFKSDYYFLGLCLYFIHVLLVNDGPIYVFNC